MPDKLIKHNMLCTSQNPMKRLVEREFDPNQAIDENKNEETKLPTKEII